MQRITPLLLIVLVLGCGSTVLDPADYDATCTADVDCLPVVAGDACAPCGCPDAAVNATEAERFATDRRDAQRLCSPFRPQVQCGPCPGLAAVCVADRCTTKRLD